MSDPLTDAREPKRERLADVLRADRRHYSRMAQRGQVARYLEHCRLMTAADAYREVERLERNHTLRFLYRLLEIACAQKRIVWRDGRFVELRKAEQ